MTGLPAGPHHQLSASKPMSVHVPIAVTISTVIVSFMLTPWLAYKILGAGRKESQQTDAPAQPRENPPGADYETTVKQRPLYRFFNRLLRPVLEHRWASYAVLGLVVLLFLLALAPPVFRLVPIKMLPCDNKDEFLVVIDLPESATLEQTNRRPARRPVRDRPLLTPRPRRNAECAGSRARLERAYRRGWRRNSLARRGQGHRRVPVIRSADGDGVDLRSPPPHPGFAIAGPCCASRSRTEPSAAKAGRRSPKSQVF